MKKKYSLQDITITSLNLTHQGGEDYTGIAEYTSPHGNGKLQVEVSFASSVDNFNWFAEPYDYGKDLEE